MKRGAGCRVGAVSARRVVISITPAGPMIDATFDLVDPDSGAVVAVTRKTRDWPEPVREALVAFIEATENAAVDRVFTASSDSTEKSIADALKGDTEK